jgi:hypothetical protein
MVLMIDTFEIFWAVFDLSRCTHQKQKDRRLHFEVQSDAHSKLWNLWMILRHWEWLVPRFMQSFHPMRRNYWWGQRALEDVSKYQYKSIQFNTNKTNKIKGCVSNGNLGHVTAQFRICDPCDRKIGWTGPWGVAQGVTAGRRPESSLSATVLSSGHRGFSHWKWQGVVSVDIGIEQFIIVHSCSFYSYFRCLKMF